MTSKPLSPAQPTPLESALRELLLDAINMVPTGYQKRWLNLKLIEIEDKARLHE